MRRKREKDEQIIEKYKSKDPMDENISVFQKNMYSVQTDFLKDDDNEDGNDLDENVVYNDQDFVIKVTNDNNGDKTGEDGTKARVSKAEKRKSRQLIDVQNFIPYKPKNYDQEKASVFLNNFFKLKSISLIINFMFLVLELIPILIEKSTMQPWI